MKKNKKPERPKKITEKTMDELQNETHNAKKQSLGPNTER